MKHQLRGVRAVLQADVQNLRRQGLDSYVPKSAQLDRHELHVPKLVLTFCGRVEAKRPHATDDAVTHELWRYQVRVN